MSDIPVYETSDVPLTVEEVVHILKNTDTSKITLLPAVQPRHGDVYVFDYSGRPECKHDW